MADGLLRSKCCSTSIEHEDADEITEDITVSGGNDEEA
jgi:hypothetical protein